MNGQVLHRQIFSNNGVSFLSKNGVYISHTIGQSVSSQTIKNSSFSIQQGFQQSTFSKLDVNIDDSKLLIETKIYPNPFHYKLTVSFSTAISGKMQVTLTDVLGRVVFFTSLLPVNNTITIEALDFLPAGSYFIILNAPNYNYKNQLIKI